MNLQRMRGTVALDVGPGGVRRLREEGAGRLRLPQVARGSPIEAVLINTAGGMTGGDVFGWDLAVGSGASLCVTTQAAEKIYRSLGDDVTITAQLTAGDPAVCSGCQCRDQDVSQ